MNLIPEGAAVQSLAQAALWIREAVPILNGRATDADCRQRRALVDALLAQRVVDPGPHLWHTAQLVDGHITSVRANSVEEAELELTVWWGHPCHWVREDPGCRLYQEYLGTGHRSSATADRTFPLGPPRRIRDQFAPATSLLDGLSSASVDRGGW